MKTRKSVGALLASGLFLGAVALASVDNGTVPAEDLTLVNETVPQASVELVHGGGGGFHGGGGYHGGYHGGGCYGGSCYGGYHGGYGYGGYHGGYYGYGNYGGYGSYYGNYGGYGCYGGYSCSRSGYAPTPMLKRSSASTSELPAPQVSEQVALASSNQA